MNDEDNITRIKAVYNALEELGDKVVFVGGATVSLYKDRPASETRVTNDVDIVIELAKYGDYANIEDQLRKKGFVNDMYSGVFCRYKIDGIMVDVMPTEENVLGFKNKWYAEGFKNAIEYSISDKERVKLFNSIYFLASKLDAFNDRGRKDGRTSSDFEDIIYILNNRNSIWEEMRSATGLIKAYLLDEFKQLLHQEYMYEWVSAHLDYSEQKRVTFVIGGLTSFTEESI